MSVSELVSRLEDVQSTVSSLFEGQFRSIENGTGALVVAPLSQTDSSNIRAWLDIAESDFTRIVLETVVKTFADQELVAWEVVSFTSRLSSRLTAVADSLRAAGEIWKQICTARLEVCLAPGGLNKEELLRYRAETESARDALLDRVVLARVCLEEIGTIMEHVRAPQDSPKSSLMRCPITGQTCNKPLSLGSNEVFVGFQFQSDHYKTVSLKAMITEALGKFNLSPFFPDEHFEPVHISCETCYALQRVSVCIFEISDSNPNVMFELGLAYMLGKLVVLLARAGSTGTQISDVAGIHRIQYEDLLECRDFIARWLEQSAMISGVLDWKRG